MEDIPQVQPLSKQHRSFFFFGLAAIFLISLPFLILYTTGYRFDFNKSTIMSTGGMYVSVDRVGAEIYIDNELVRETRTFRRAFYAQSLTPGTHRVHVQKEDHHTWVKELPVYPHLVTEGLAFNLPLVADVRTITPWRSAAGNSVALATSTLLASSTNSYVVATSTNTKSLLPDTEFQTLLSLFGSTTATATPTFIERVSENFTFTPDIATSTDTVAATSTKESGGVRLYEDGSVVVAEYIGSRETMPYYYCAEEFALLGTSTAPILLEEARVKAAQAAQAVESVIEEETLNDPVQQVSDTMECVPQIKMDPKGETIRSFDFYPGSTDLVIVVTETGVYVQEIDDRAWQNRQPLVVGDTLDMRVENGSVYVYDGTLIYQILLEN